MGQRLTQPIFKRGMRFTVVRPIRLSRDTVLQPGDSVGLREAHARSLYQRRRIGPEGSAWTKAMIDLWNAGTPNRMPEAGAEIPVPYDIIEPSRNAPQVQTAEPVEPAEPAEPVEPVKEGKNWTVPGLRGQIFKTKKEAQAYLDAQEASEPEGDDESDAWE